MPNEMSQAACAGLDPEMFFDRARIRQAKQVCFTCPLIDTCLLEALHIETELALAERGAIRADGVYGGRTGTERKPLIAARLQRRLAAAA